MTASEAIQQISAQDLSKILETQQICLIDVRELNEWQSFRIPKALHIPKAQLADTIASVTKDKDQPVYLYCLGGVRSLHAAEILSELGYTQLYSLQGGLAEWRMFGYLVEE